MLNELLPHEALAVARRRRGWNQATAADAVGIGIHDYVSLETGRLIPGWYERGVEIAAKIEREFGIESSAWARKVAA